MNRKFIKIIFGVISLIFLIVSQSDISAQSVNQELEPIVIIPGIIGSWNWSVMFNSNLSDSWDFIPNDKTWDKMIQELEYAGYEMDENLFVAFYDWRKSNVDSANNYLIPTIDKALESSSTGKVNIIAYSMGGLVARQYIQSNQYREDVNKLVMLGTPNLGSADVYVLWAGGEIPGGWTKNQRALAGRYVDLMGISNSGVSGDLEVVRTFFPSVQELLPVYDFLEDSEGNLKSYHDLVDTSNPFIEDLKDSANNLTKLGGLIILAGTSTPTIETIPVVARDFDEDADSWFDGKPDPIDPLPNSAEGDNRVMSWSVLLTRDDISPQLSSLNLWQRLVAGLFPKAHADVDWDTFLVTKEINSNHGSLPTLAIRDVFEALSLNPEPIPNYGPIEEPDNIVSFWLASPVAVKITDPQGRSITKDYNQIPGAEYDGETDPNGVKFVMIENALIGEYEIELTGTGVGGYHLLASVTSDTSDEVSVVEGNIVVGEKHQYKVEIETEDSVAPEISEPKIIEPEAPPKELTLKDLLALLREKINSLNIRPIAKKILLKKVDNLEKHLNKKGTDKKLVDKVEKEMRKNKWLREGVDNLSNQEIAEIIDEIEKRLNGKNIIQSILERLKEKNNSSQR